MRKWVLCSFLIFMGVSLCNPNVAGETTTSGPHEITKKDKCPVCGMFVWKYPKWAVQIAFKDGTYVSFDGPKDMFKYYLDMKKYNPSKGPEDISSIWVKDYYTVKWIDAREAFFVEGSDVLGPMGLELIPQSSKRNAKQFVKDHVGERLSGGIKLIHEGKKIYRFEEVDRDLIEGLR